MRRPQRPLPQLVAEVLDPDAHERRQRAQPGPGRDLHRRRLRVPVFLGIRAWVKRGAFWGLVTLLPIAQMAATGTFLSGHRVLLACLPGFIELADLLKNRLAYMITIALSVVVQLFLLNNYIHWGFAG